MSFLFYFACAGYIKLKFYSLKYRILLLGDRMDPSFV